MNKYQKALNNLKTVDYEDLYDDRDLEWCETLQELVNKETPKKIRIKLSDTISFYCPKCSRKLKRDRSYKYCPRCGQALSWDNV